jgi:predicted ester cyclase
MSSVGVLREVMQRLEETFNNPQKRESNYFDFYDDSLRIHGFPPNLPANKEGFKQFVHVLWKAFPDMRITYEDIVIEGNKVACRYSITGTHKGEFTVSLYLAYGKFFPTDKQFKINGMTIFSFQDSKCIERWNVIDNLSLMEQLRP